MSSMNGADLSRRGTWLCSLLVNTSVNWPLNSLAFSKSDWARPLPCLFFKGGNTLGIFFLTVYITIKIPRISLHITNQVIHIQIMLLPYICFDFSSSSFKFGSNFGTARPFSLCMSFMFLANLSSSFRCYPWD